MLNVITIKSFDKSFKKLDPSLKEKTKVRIRLFREDPFNSLLNNHALHGEYESKRSFNVTGDYRVVFFYYNENTVCFVDVGTHSELYE